MNILFFYIQHIVHTFLCAYIHTYIYVYVHIYEYVYSTYICLTIYTNSYLHIVYKKKQNTQERNKEMNECFIFIFFYYFFIFLFINKY